MSDMGDQQDGIIERAGQAGAEDEPSLWKKVPYPS